MNTIERASTALSLGVGALAGDTAGWLGRGRVYGLNVRIPSLRFPLIAAAIESALGSATPCTLVLRSKPDAYLAQINTPARMDIDAHLASGALGVLVMREEFGKRMFQLGAARFTRELSGFGVVPGSLVIFEHANDLLNMRDKGLAIQQIEALDAWCKAQACTGLLVFSGNPERNTVPVTDLLDTFAGLAVLEAGQGHLTIDFPYWQCDGRLSGCHHATLHMDGRGHYRVGAAAGRGAGVGVGVGGIHHPSDLGNDSVHGGDALPAPQPEAEASFDPAATIRAPDVIVDEERESRTETQNHRAGAAALVPLRSFEGRSSTVRSVVPARTYSAVQATRVRIAQTEKEET